MSDKSLRIQLIFDALDRVTKPLENIGRQGDKAREALSGTKAEMKALYAAQKDLKKFGELSADFSRTATELAAAEQATKALRMEMAKVDAPAKNMQIAFERAEKTEAKLRAQHEHHGKAITELSRKMEAAGVDINDLSAHEERLKMRMYETNKALSDQAKKLDDIKASAARANQMKEAGGQMMGMGGSAIGAGVAMGAPILLSYNNAKNFEASVADIRKVMDFTPESFRLINSDLLDMSTRVPVAAEGLAQIAAAAGSAGVGRELLQKGDMAGARKELMAYTETAAKMGVAFGITADEAGGTMAKWKTAFNLPLDDIVRLGDQVNALTNRYGGNVASVTEMVTRIGALAEVAGVTPDLLTAMAQTMNSVGVESEIGATGIKNMMLALTKGEAATKSQAEAFAKLGLDATDVAKRMQTDAGGAITDVLSRLSKLPKETQAGTLTNLFGSESVAAIAPLLTKLDQLQVAMGLVGDKSLYAGSMNAEFLARVATTEGVTGLAGNAIKALSIEVGNGLLPTITAAAPHVTNMANGFRKWASEHPMLSGALTTFVAVATGLTVVLGGLMVAAGAATFAFGALGITTWAALWPILAVIAGIAALIAVVMLIITHFDKIKPAVMGAFAFVMAWAKKAVAFLWSVFLNSNPLGWLIQGFGKVVEYLKTLDLKKIGSDIVSGLVSAITGGIPGLVTAFVKMAAAGIDAFKQKLGIKSPSRVMMGLGGFINEGLTDGLAASQSGPIGRMQSIAASITDQIRTGMGAITVSGGSLAAGMGGAGAMAGAASIQIGTLNIPVQAAPGQSPGDIAAEVWRMFEARMEQLQARARAAYRDEEN